MAQTELVHCPACGTGIVGFVSLRSLLIDLDPWFHWEAILVNHPDLSHAIISFDHFHFD